MIKRFWVWVVHLLAFPGWALLSLSLNGVLFVIVVLLLRQGATVSSLESRDPEAPGAPPAVLDDAAGGVSVLPPARATSAPPELGAPSSPPGLGKRHQLTYQQWIDLLRREAIAMGRQHPDDLNVLLGDSISLWFPPDLFPPHQTWLNQGISGETTAGLRQRLALLDPLRPETIFLMIGINDLLGEKSDREIVTHYRHIVAALREAHPDATLIVQSILPHGAEQATWEGRDRLLAIPNHRIATLNHTLEQIALDAGADYLDLYTLFADDDGRLHRHLTTDGLHLNAQGYRVWQTAIALYVP